MQGFLQTNLLQTSKAMEDKNGPCRRRERELERGQKKKTKTQGHMNNLLNSSKCTTHLVSGAVEWGWSKQKVNVISNKTAVKEEKWSFCKI